MEGKEWANTTPIRNANFISASLGEPVRCHEAYCEGCLRKETRRPCHFETRSDAQALCSSRTLAFPTPLCDPAMTMIFILRSSWHRKRVQAATLTAIDRATSCPSRAYISTRHVCTRRSSKAKSADSARLEVVAAVRPPRQRSLVSAAATSNGAGCPAVNRVGADRRGRSDQS